MYFQSVNFIIFFVVLLSQYYACPAALRWAAGLGGLCYAVFRHADPSGGLADGGCILLLLGLAGYLRRKASDVEAKKFILLAGSLFFYSTHLLLLMVLALVLAVSLWTFFAGRAVARFDGRRGKKAALACGLGVVLLPLCFYKYREFLLANAEALAAALGLALPGQFAGALSPFWAMFVPAGISFYTFKAVSYLMDVYRGRLPARASWLDVTLYLSFFPTVLSGPIDRAGPFFDRLAAEKRFDPGRAKEGVLQFLGGLAKKLLVADALKPIADQAFYAPGDYSGFALLIAAYCYSFQIYCDFAGYSDMAIGLGKIMGFAVPENFRFPYFTPNISEFWRRWHISLSTWLRDYLYISFGGSRAGRVRTLGNLLATMLIGGLWHGASWNFVLWGGLHGAMLMIHRLVTWGRGSAGAGERGFFQKAAWALVNFQFVTLAWILFRADTLEAAGVMLRRIFLWESGLMVPFLYPLVLIPLFMLIELAQLRFGFIPRLMAHPRLSRLLIYAAALIFFMIVQSTRSVVFVYFAF